MQTSAAHRKATPDGSQKKNSSGSLNVTLENALAVQGFRILTFTKAQIQSLVRELDLTSCGEDPPPQTQQQDGERNSNSNSYTASFLGGWECVSLLNANARILTPRNTRQLGRMEWEDSP